MARRNKSKSAQSSLSTSWLRGLIRHKLATYVIALAIAIIGVFGAFSIFASGGVIAPPQTFTNVAYGAGADQKLDLYLPQRLGTAIPVIIKIHGGAFVEGDKTDDMAYLKDTVLSKGWAIASINYRLIDSDPDTFPEGVQDVRSATRWLRAHAAEYGINTNKFAAWGESAGGYMAEMLGVTGDVHNAYFDGTNPENASYSSSVQGVLSYFGPSDLDKLLNDSSPGCDVSYDDFSLISSFLISDSVLKNSVLEQYVNSSAAPLYMAHGTADCVVPLAQSQEMKQAYDTAGATAVLQTIQGADHGDQPLMDANVAPALAFLSDAFAGQQVTTPAPTLIMTPTPNAATPTTPTPTPVVSTPAATAQPGTTNQPPTNNGDIDHNGVVDSVDLSLLLQGWVSGPTQDDLNADSDINVYDLSILLSHWTH